MRKGEETLNNYIFCNELFLRIVDKKFKIVYFVVMQNESSSSTDKLKSENRVKRDNGFSERYNKFFLSWLNGATLETLIALYPDEGDIKFPLKCPHLWYFTREYKINGSPQFGFKEPVKIILFNKEEDRRLALAQYPNLFQKTAVKNDEVFSSIEKNMEIWRHRHIKIFDYYILYGQFFNQIYV